MADQLSLLPGHHIQLPGCHCCLHLSCGVHRMAQQPAPVGWILHPVINHQLPLLKPQQAPLQSHLSLHGCSRYHPTLPHQPADVQPAHHAAHIVPSRTFAPARDTDFLSLPAKRTVSMLLKLSPAACRRDPPCCHQRGGEGLLRGGRGGEGALPARQPLPRWAECSRPEVRDGCLGDWDVCVHGLAVQAERVGYANGKQAAHEKASQSSCGKWSMRWASLHFLPWYVLSLSRAARASPETFMFRCASVRSGCSASSRSPMSLSGSSGTSLGTLLQAIGLRVLGVESSCIVATQRSSALCRIATGVDCSKATSTCNRYEQNPLLPFNLQSREDTESRRPACTSATWSSVCVPAKLQALRQPAAWQCVVAAGLPWASYSAMLKAWLEPTVEPHCRHLGQSPHGVPSPTLWLQPTWSQSNARAMQTISMPTAAILPQAPISTTPTSQTQEQAFSTSSAAPAIATANTTAAASSTQPPGGCSHQGSWSWALPHHIQSAQPSFTLLLARESAGRWLRQLASQHALLRAAAAATGWLLAKRLRTEPEPFEAEFDDDELEGGEFEDLAGGVIFADFELGSSFPDLEPLVLPPLEDLDEAEDAMDDVLDGPRPKKKETAS
ncbi:hypothetical protein HaLaN_02664 [Haematococcus lacustris]|uniref:Uncharacterized protein n=1 Tax=Haematococcus lacustris TaxID=44745 RepID=A0A699YLV8_HAELA|nr:hypothetical protein HaLaN_02664 [Haematococcus lacustris]